MSSFPVSLRSILDGKPPDIALEAPRHQSLGASGGGVGPDVQPSLVDAALICKEFLNLRHVIECGLLSGLLARPDRCRWPRW